MCWRATTTPPGRDLRFLRSVSLPDRIECVDGAAGMAKRPPEVERLVEKQRDLLVTERRAHLPVRFENSTERLAPLVRLACVTLHDAVGGIACQAGRHERQQDRLGEDEPVRDLQEG